MNHFFAGAKITLITTLLFSLAVFATIYFQSYWQAYSTYIEFLVYVIAVAAVLFSWQFSQSRYFYLVVIIFASYLMQPYLYPWLYKLSLTNHHATLFLFSCLLYLSLVKDRAVWSVHFYMRILGFSCCAAFSWAIFWGLNWLNSQPDYMQYLGMFNQIKGSFWLLFFVTLICWRSLKQPQSVVTALCLTATLIWLYLEQLIVLPLAVGCLLLLSLIMVLMVVDSYVLAYRDELTGLPTRRALQNLALSLGRKYTVAMLDVDHFKKFNDTYGHDIGDQVLKLVASQLKKVKAGGKIFRYGGEEFTVVFQGKDEERVFAELDKLRQSIADYQMVIRQTPRQDKTSRNKSAKPQSKTVSVTISIGFAERKTKQNFAQTLKQADIALYKAKKSGRNKVCN